MDGREGSSSAIVIEQPSNDGLLTSQCLENEERLMMLELNEDFLTNVPKIQVHHIETGGQCAHEVSSTRFCS